MKIRINGITYQYEILSVPRSGRFHFSIRAIHLLSSRSSTITTVNPILSEFSISDNDIKLKESIWEVDKKQSTSLMLTAKEILSHRYYIKYLEKILDEDRLQSEWENIN